jgi:hypothetical protein
MEDILKDIGLSRFIYVLRDKNYTLRYFIQVVKSQGNAQQMRENVMLDCGLSKEAVLAICDKVREQVDRDE